MDEVTDNTQCNHEWVGRRVGGSPDDIGSYKWVVYCQKCGMEKQEE